VAEKILSERNADHRALMAELDAAGAPRLLVEHPGETRRSRRFHIGEARRAHRRAERRQFPVRRAFRLQAIAEIRERLEEQWHCQRHVALRLAERDLNVPARVDELERESKQNG
jgi:hypothetical protein